VFSVTATTAPRPAVDKYRTAEGVERSPKEPLLPADKVSLSSEARRELRRIGEVGGQEPRSGGESTSTGTEPRPPAKGDAGGPGTAGTKGAAGTAAGRSAQLDADQQRQLQDLQQRDTHVRQHEAAHQAAGGDLTGAASFSYETGPDGRSYAVGGEVPVQARSGRTADETITIARRVRAAALAPADPSPADLAAAAAATQVELKAMQQKQQLTARQAGSGAPARDPGAARPPAQTQPITTPQANLERLIVRAPEAEQFM
jgi:hypothetical protein